MNDPCAQAAAMAINTAGVGWRVACGQRSARSIAGNLCRKVDGYPDSFATKAPGDRARRSWDGEGRRDETRKRRRDEETETR